MLNQSMLSRKMLKYYRKDYSLVLGLETLSIALLFSFLSIALSESFMNRYIVDPVISSNILFPTYLSILFTIVIIFVTSKVFWNARKKDYGILMSLGLSRRESTLNIAKENAFLSVISLGFGLMAGTFLSLIFYLVTRYLIGIEGLVFMDNLKAYLYTTVGFAFISIFSIFINSIIFKNESILSKLRSFTKEKDSLKFRFQKERKPEKWNRNIVKNAFLRKHKNMWNIRYLTVVIILIGIMFNTSLCVGLFPSGARNEVMYSPYDLLYSEMDSVNQGVEDEIHSILEKNNIKVLDEITFNLYRDGANNYMSVDEINKLFNTSYSLKEGQFLTLFQVDLKDGYNHELLEKAYLNIGNKKLESAGSDIQILFNDNLSFADNTILLSQQDYNTLAANDSLIFETIHAYTFDDWKNSKRAVNEIDEMLNRINGVSFEEQYSFQTSSRIQAHRDHLQSAMFLSFLLFFSTSMLILSALAIIYSGLKSEETEHLKMIISLKKCGIEKEKLKEILRNRNITRYLVPFAIGIIIGMIPMILINIGMCQMTLPVMAIELIIAFIIILIGLLASGKQRTAY